MRGIHHYLALLSFIAFSQLGSAQEKDCSELLVQKSDPKKTAYYANPTKKFKSNGKTQKTIDEIRVRDQCAIGSCWIHSTLSQIEAYIREKTGETIQLSASWLLAHSLIEKGADVIEGNRVTIKTGASLNLAMHLMAGS